MKQPQWFEIQAAQRPDSRVTAWRDGPALNECQIDFASTDQADILHRPRGFPDIEIDPLFGEKIGISHREIVIGAAFLASGDSQRFRRSGLYEVPGKVKTRHQYDDCRTVDCQQVFPLIQAPAHRVYAVFSTSVAGSRSPDSTPEPPAPAA